MLLLLLLHGLHRVCAVGVPVGRVVADRGWSRGSRVTSLLPRRHAGLARAPYAGPAGRSRPRPRRRPRHRSAGISTTSAGSSSPAVGEAARRRSSSRRIGSMNGSPACETPPPTTTRLDVVGHDQQVDGPGEPAADVLDQLAGEGVAGGRGLVDVACREGGRVEVGEGRRAARRDRRGRAAGDGRAGDERLEAAALAAGADRAVRVEDGVPDLAGQAAGAAVEPAVEDEAGRDAGPDREVGDVVGRRRGRARRWRPTAAARASFSMTHGRPRRRSSASRSARSFQPRLTARVTWPVAGSTRPGTPTPTTATSVEVGARALRARGR